MWLSMGFPVEGPQARDGAWLVEITNQLDLAKWPADCRVGVRGERPHPGAQMRFTDSNGHRFTAFITDTDGGELAELAVRYRSHAPVEDRIRCAKSTGLPNLPCKSSPRTKFGSSSAWPPADLITWSRRCASPASWLAANPRPSASVACWK